jgi:hypothetical protein
VLAQSILQMTTIFRGMIHYYHYIKWWTTSVRLLY